MEALVELSQLLSSDPTLVAEVRLAIERPTDYMGQHAVRLARRGVEKPAPPGLPWIALIDGLIERRLVAEVARADDPPEVQGAIDELLQARGLPAMDWAWAGGDDLEDWWDREVDEFLSAIAAELENQALSLVELQTEGESYPLTIVSQDLVPELSQKARGAEIGGLQALG